MFNPDNPIIVQSDRTLLVEVNSPKYTEVRDQLARFAELIRSPEHIHTYQITPLSLWNAASTGLHTEEIIESLTSYARYPVPDLILRDIQAQMDRYGQIRLLPGDPDLVLEFRDIQFTRELVADKRIQKFLRPHPKENCFSIPILYRGEIKQALIRMGYPVEDRAGYSEGEQMDIAFRTTTREGASFALRDYQQEAIDIFYAGGGPEGGHGVVVLPCGAGKTVIGMGAMVTAQTNTLILVNNITACRQWIREILDKTDIDEEQIGEYSGDRKEIKPITVATYQILTHRPSRTEDFTHLHVFQARNWGLLLYDEVHLLPAPVFRFTSSLQAKRRMGLTATLVREDGLEEDVFCLIGPKRYDLPWRDLEQRGHIAQAQCNELRVPLPLTERIRYATATDRGKVRISAENSYKMEVVAELCEQHKEDHILVIGQYLDQLRALAKHLDAPLLTGQTKHAKRETMYEDFRNGVTRLMVVSKVANFAIDLPDANILVQVSGAFGSRQEEAQRLGRILRPKERQAIFYSLVSRDTCEQEFALRRQRFLAEQGYQYQIRDIEPPPEDEL